LAVFDPLAAALAEARVEGAATWLMVTAALALAEFEMKRLATALVEVEVEARIKDIIFGDIERGGGER